MLCFSRKKKNSIERCSNKCLKNLMFCGVHVKLKYKKLWFDDKHIESFIKFQAQCKRRLITNVLKLAGPGVLNRSVCHNTEELFTCEEAKELTPKNYFAFEEDGKIYWFDIRTIYQWSGQSLEPQNPYTKQPLTIETRKRIKRIIGIRELYNVPIFHNPKYLQTVDQIKFIWIQIIQILNENLFADITEPYFVHLDENQILNFCNNIYREVKCWYGKKNNLGIYCLWINYAMNFLEVDFYRGYVPFLITILAILKNHKHQYDFAFKLLSARARL